MTYREATRKLRALGCQELPRREEFGTFLTN